MALVRAQEDAPRVSFVLPDEIIFNKESSQEGLLEVYKNRK